MAGLLIAQEMPPLELGRNVSHDSPEFELRGVEHQLGVMERYRAAESVSTRLIT